ncbi:MAG: bifunctional 4-hydroxy-2-oxoglutarate aldolase/2-dehydro-3-deoxy-phosphogluconate aldolase [Acidimicrobiia bacterium]|nr:bifunctional 4-hydroxy-2-oxoglutarate aldolase/2-dehydro-3-deoxy-phosphogluconate aldolase [Acidimicrobiia bacterium]
MSIFDEIAAIGVVPVLVVDTDVDVAGLADALVDGGLPCAEVTFRTPAAIEAVAALSAARPDLLVGAGTVLTVAQAEAATAAGARFVVSPHFDAEVVAWCVDRGIPVAPGAATPTEVVTAMRSGAGLVKFFPAESAGGVRALATLSGVYPGVRFMPTGGIDADNLADYLAIPAVAACGGTWIAPRVGGGGRAPPPGGPGAPRPAPPRAGGGGGGRRRPGGGGGGGGAGR